MNLDIFLRFLIDQASKQKTLEGIDEVQKKTYQGSYPGDELGADFQKFTDEYTAQQQKITALSSGTKAKLISDALSTADQQVKISDKQADQIIANSQRVGQIQRLQSREMLRLADAVGIAAQTALLAGGAITGGLFAMAAKYVKDAKEATQVTYEWQASTRSLGDSEDRIGAVVARTILPALEQAAVIADKVAAFVEQHPDIIKAALNIGGALVALGAVGMAVSKGIRMYADLQFLTASNTQIDAARLQLEASLNQLEAAGISRENGLLKGASGVGAMGILGGVGQAVAAVAIVAIGIGVAEQLGNVLAKWINGPNTKDQNVGNAIQTAYRIGSLPGMALHQWLNKLGIESDQTAHKIGDIYSSIDAFIGRLVGAKGAADAAGQQLDALNVKLGQLAGSPHEQEIVKAYGDMLDKESAATDKYSKQRLDVIQKEGQDEIKAAEQLQNHIDDLNANYAQQVGNIVASATRADAQAEQRYQDERSKIVRDGGIEVQRIEAQHQQRMRQLEEQHNDRVYDLESSRDALGLVREQHSYDEQRAREEESTRVEIGQRRQDIALRLRDGARQAQIERQQRAQQLAENLAQATEQHAKELAQARADNELRVKELRSQEDDRLRQLKEGYDQEKGALREAFVSFVRETDVSLLGPQIKLQQQAYKTMLTDAQNFLNSYRTALPTYSSNASTGGSSSTRHDYSGYATTGLYRMAQDGLAEFVLGGRATKAAEKIVGGQLTEQVLLSALLGAPGRSLNYQDNRRFSSAISARDRRQIQRDTLETLSSLLPA